MLLSKGVALNILLSLAAQISGMKVEWRYRKPDNFDLSIAANSVAILSGHGPCTPIHYGMDEECYPEHLFVAFRKETTLQLFVLVFEIKDYSYFEVKLGEKEDKKLSSQLFPDMEAVKKAFCLTDSTMKTIQKVAAQSVTNVIENPKLAAGCFALCFAITTGVQLWAESNRQG